ncbi:DUF2993 domain-containing protein [Streptomyces griseorubiginosus]|uniref:LmeA family phospholipid-binding protein n=1 Tax=Streptomyces griseorubiginosus TaxID=67304 RepID=UPI00363E8474
MWPVADRYRILLRLAPQHLGADRLAEVPAPARDTAEAIIGQGQRHGAFLTGIPAALTGIPAALTGIPAAVRARAPEGHLLGHPDRVNSGVRSDDGTDTATAALIAMGVPGDSAATRVRGFVRPAGGTAWAHFTKHRSKRRTMHQYHRDEEYAGEARYGDSSTYVSPPTRTRRRMIIATVSLAALLVGGVAVDRIAAARAESRTAEAFQDGMGTAERPFVHVSGFPVLTQLAAGSLGHVDLTAHDIPADGTTRPLPVTKLTVGMDGLKTSGSADEAHADSVTATAFLSYADMSSALGVQVSQGDKPGRVDATASLPLVGDVTVSAAVSAASGNRIAFTDVRAEQGELLPPLKSLLDKVLNEPVALRNVPEGLHLRSVSTTEDGIDARFTGRSVAFHPDSSTERSQSQS